MVEPDSAPRPKLISYRVICLFIYYPYVQYRKQKRGEILSLVIVVIIQTNHINRNLMDPLKVFRSSMDRGPLNYYTWGIIKRRNCVENVPGVEMLGIIK